MAQSLLKQYPNEIVLPVDAALSDSFADTKPLFNPNKPLEIPANLMGLDIGPKSIEVFVKHIQGAKTVIWNGPLGVTEFKNYATGTQAIAKAIGALGPDAYTVVGGGDSVAAIQKLKLTSQFSHISTGGGACLAMLEGTLLPGIEAIQNVGDEPREDTPSLEQTLELVNNSETMLDVMNSVLKNKKPPKGERKIDKKK